MTKLSSYSNQYSILLVVQNEKRKKKQSGKVSQGHFSIKNEKGITWITAQTGKGQGI